MITRIAMPCGLNTFGFMKLCLRYASNVPSYPVAIVTGSSNGIGRMIAVELARNGYRITIHGRNPKSIAETADLCMAGGADKRNIFCFEGDLSKDKILEQLPKETLEKFGRIDALINNAGEVSLPDKMAVFEGEWFDRIMRVNLRAPLVLTKHCIEALKLSKGTVLNISSLAADNQRIFTYGITKAGLEQFTRSLALELAPHNVRVNCLKPGMIVTQMWGRHFQLSDEEKEQYARDLGKYFHPIRRLTTEEDITNAVTFLLSEKASFITGAILPVCGGAQLPYDGRVLQYKDEMNSRMGTNDVSLQ